MPWLRKMGNLLHGTPVAGSGLPAFFNGMWFGVD